MIPTTSLHDVVDVEGFVARTMVKSRIRFATDEKEELLAEGITIMYELAARYEPHRPGYDQAGRFSGYAAQMLPLRMRDAWLKLHPEHITHRTGGRKTVEYGDPALSLDQPRHRSEDGRGREADLPPLRDALEDRRPATLDVDLVDQALALLPPAQRMRAHLTIDGLAQGQGVDEIAADLGLGRGAVTGIRTTVASAIGYLQERQAA